MRTALALVAALVVVSPAVAHEYHHGGWGYHGGYRHGGGGIGPGAAFGLGVLGGALGGALVAPYAYGGGYYPYSSYQPHYNWVCDPYGQCGWIYQ
jgi:hypothetical protein